VTLKQIPILAVAAGAVGGAVIWREYGALAAAGIMCIVAIWLVLWLVLFRRAPK
jgi:uncharacterized membrane protein YoaK (UPF0700 family)